MSLPEWPAVIRDALNTVQSLDGSGRPVLGMLAPLWNWWQQFKSWVNTQMATNQDFTLATKSKGVVMTNAAGTVTKRARLNDAGNGWIFEDV